MCNSFFFGVNFRLFIQENTGKTFTRKLSKREKKEKKKQNKAKQRDHGGGLADKLYTDMPESKFTRSISNPEAVMKRRRQMKVEKKLQQCRGQDGQGLGFVEMIGEGFRNAHFLLYFSKGMICTVVTFSLKATPIKGHPPYQARCQMY